MSRAEKQLRRKRRKQRKYARSYWSDRIISDFDVDIPPSLCLLEYEITRDPLELAEERDPDLEAAIADRQQELFDLVHNDARSAIPELETLLERFPNSRLLMNWLSAAYQRIGDHEKADSMITLCYQRHPDYLFARTNLAAIHLQNGDPAQADAVMQHKWDLKLMYPHRDVFHVSEFIAMSHVAVDYFMQTGERRAAELILESMVELAPDHEATKSAQKMMRSDLFQFLERLARRSRRYLLPER
jgi:tetratricopeptide (TPR) repeat protein